ncbi:hypothetical protein [Mesorhizobium amorphae]|uniref:hypothetical protein n=1 Tax=Mesorhizobium amorphae TaxID=71433 RepID=UPI003F507810
MKNEQKQSVELDCNQRLLTHMLQYEESITVIDGNLTSRYGRLRVGSAARAVFDVQAGCPHGGVSRHRNEMPSLIAATERVVTS